MKRIFTTILVAACALVSNAATIAFWDFNDPSLGAANGVPLPDSDAYSVWREAATDKSGNGNHLTTWDYSGAGFFWSNISPEGDFSIKAAGGYPAAYTWSSQSAPSGTDLETAILTEWTIEGVFTVASGSGARTLLGRDGRYLSSGAPANAALYFQIDWDDHPALEFTDVNSNRVRLVASTTVVEDSATWYHMAGVSDGSTVSLYLDHQLIASTNVAMGAIASGAVADPDWHTGGWSVARGLYNGNHVDRWFGSIDSIAISDTALDENSFVLDVPNYTNTVPGFSDVTNETVYLFCYHVGGWPTGGDSGVFLNWSIDGYNFYPLNNGHPVFVCPELPEDDADDGAADANMTRDPSIIYGTDGLYHMVWTSELNTRSFGYAESADLKNWTNVKLVEMWPTSTVSSVDHTWAPEWFYNEDAGTYMVIFSSGVEGASLRLWYTETTDFDTFSTPTELYHDVAQSSVIDGFIAKVDTNQYMMATAQKGTIWIVDSSSPYGPWTERGSSAMPSPREGPAFFKIRDTWHLYADYYAGVSDDVFRMAISTNTTSWTDQSALTRLPANIDVPDFDGPPHHGTIFEAPLSTLGEFLVEPAAALTNLSSLVYRWSFNEAAGPASAGTTVTDSVSGAVAEIVGNRASFTGTELQLPGDTDATGDAAYLDLPNGIISSLSNLTLEIWVTPIASRNWQRLFSFGRTVETGDGGGEWDGPASGGTSARDTLFMSLNRDGSNDRQRLDMLVYGETTSQSDIAMDTSLNTQYHYVVTYERGAGHHSATGGRINVYRDGVWITYLDVGFTLDDLQDVNNWLGRSQWSSDSNSNVEYDEVRIYSGVLSWYDVYGHYLAGPDVPVNGTPSLEIAVDGARSCRVRWPGNTVGFSLKKTGGLGHMNPWSPVTNEVQNSSQGYHVTVPRSEGEEYYRLEK